MPSGGPSGWATGSQAEPCSGSAIPWTGDPWQCRTGASCAPRIPHRASGGGSCSRWACASSATPWMRSGRDGSSCGIRITASPLGNRRSTARPVSTVPNCHRSAQRLTAGPSSSKPHNQNSTKPRSVQPAGAFLRHSRARKHNDPHSATITTQPPDRTTKNTLLRGPDPRRVFVAVCGCCRLRMGSCGLYPQQAEVLLAITNSFGRGCVNGVNLKLIGGNESSAKARISSNLVNWKKDYQSAYIIYSDASGLHETKSINLLDLI